MNAASSKPSDPLLNEALEVAKTGDLRAAIQILENDDKTITIHQRMSALAHFHYKCDDFVTSKEWALKALQKYSKNRLALTTLAEISYQSGQLEQAIHFFDEAYHSYPKNEYIAARLARLLIESDQLERAIGHLTKARELHTENTELLDLLELAYLATGQTGLVDELRRLRKEMHPNRSMSVVEGFLASVSQLPIDKAIAQLTKVISISIYADDRRILEKLTDLLTHDSQFEKAYEILLKLVQLFPKVFAYRLKASACLSRLGQGTEAIELLKVIPPSKQDESFQMYYVEALAACGRVQEAMDLSVRLVLKKPKNKRARAVIALLRRRGVQPTPGLLEEDVDG